MSLRSKEGHGTNLSAEYLSWGYLPISEFYSFHKTGSWGRCWSCCWQSSSLSCFWASYHKSCQRGGTSTTPRPSSSPQSRTPSSHPTWYSVMSLCASGCTPRGLWASRLIPCIHLWSAEDPKDRGPLCRYISIYTKRSRWLYNLRSFCTLAGPFARWGAIDTRRWLSKCWI